MSKYAGNPNFILNPKTGRWVKKTGPIGQKLIGGPTQPRAQPSLQSSAQPSLQSSAQPRDQPSLQLSDQSFINFASKTLLASEIVTVILTFTVIKKANKHKLEIFSNQYNGSHYHEEYDSLEEATHKYNMILNAMGKN